MSLAEDLGNSEESLKKMNQAAVEFESTVNAINEKLKSIAKQEKDVADIIKVATKNNSALQASANAVSKLRKEALTDTKKQQKLQEAQTKFSNLQAKSEAIQAVLKDRMKNASGEELENILQTQELTSDIQRSSQETADNFQEIADATEKVNKAAKGFDKMAMVLDSIPGVGPIVSGAFKNAAEAARNAAASGNSFFESLVKGGAELVTTKGILTLLTTTLFSADKRTTNLATNLQISKEEAREINKDFADISVNSGKAFMNSANLVEATIELSKNFGVANKLSSDLVKSQTFLTKQLGLSAEEASEIQKLNAETGKSAEQTEKEIADQVASLQKETGIALKLDDVFADVANTNEQLKASFGFNTEEIAKSVVKAKQLGLTIEQSARAAESLLDFEQSIQNELQAELLTGKNLNLEQARLLALQGKSTDAAAELVKQVGSVEEFTNMNVIQQRNLAAAVGMEANELIKTVRQKELLAELGAKDLAQAAQTEEGRQKILDLGGEQLLQQVQQESAAAKFESAVIKIQEAIGTMVEGPLGKFIDGFASVVSSAGALKAIMVGIGALSLGRVIASLASMAAANAANATAALTFASAISFGIGIVAILGAVVAGLATMNSEADKAASKLKKKDDVMIGPDGGTIVSGPEGSIQLNQKDSIIAGTDLFGGDNTASTTAPVNISTKSLEGKIDQLIAINQQILAKSPVIEMSGNRVGQGINVAERAIQ